MKIFFCFIAYTTSCQIQGTGLGLLDLLAQMWPRLALGGTGLPELDLYNIVLVLQKTDKIACQRALSFTEFSLWRHHTKYWFTFTLS